MRPASAGGALKQRSRLQVKTGCRGLCRRTEPRDAEAQMISFLEHGHIPILSFKASREKVEASLSRPLQIVRTELMDIATDILDRVVGTWGCVEQLVEETRGDRIDRREAEEFLEEYLRYHNVPGQLQVRWVNKLNSGGKLQEYGRRGEPTGRRLRLWINSGFSGARYSRSMVAFAEHEICTHAVRAINDHVQVWVNNRRRYGLCSRGREGLSTEEGLASLNSLLCYPSQTRYLWSAAMLYYCAVKGQEMGFGELHNHLAKYVRCPAKRYWYCVRTKGKRADLDKPGACGKGQVYLEGAVDILRAVDDIDFRVLYSGRVPLSKLARVKNIVRSALVTLPRFVQDQAKYKATLKQIGRLNGILPRAHHAKVGPKNHRANLAKGPTAAAYDKRRTAARRAKPHTRTTPPQRGDFFIQQVAPTPVPPSPPIIIAAGSSAHETDLSSVSDTRLTEEEAVPTPLTTPLADGYIGTVGELTGGYSVASDGGEGISAKSNTARWRTAETKEGYEESSGHNGQDGNTLQLSPTLVNDTSVFRAAVDPSRPHTSPMVVVNRACHGGRRSSAGDAGGRCHSSPCEVVNRPSGSRGDMKTFKSHNGAGRLLAGSHGWPLCSSGGHNFGNIHTIKGDELLAPGSGGLVYGTLPQLVDEKNSLMASLMIP